MTATIILQSPSDRAKATDWIRRAPDGSRITFVRPDEVKRSNPQNDRFHGMCRDIAKQIPSYHGLRLTEDEWKQVFLDALRRDLKLVPSLDGTGMVALRMNSSALKTKEFADLITIVMAFGDQNGVKFKADAILEHSYERT